MNRQHLAIFGYIIAICLMLQAFKIPFNWFLFLGVVVAVTTTVYTFISPEFRARKW